MASEDGKSFKLAFVVKLFQKHFKDSDKTKLSSKDAAGAMVTELIRVFIQETVMRAATQAENEESPTCEVEHIEKILPQLLLDF